MRPSYDQLEGIYVENNQENHLIIADIYTDLGLFWCLFVEGK